MRAVVQRVASAAVHSEGELLGTIQQGLLVLLGIEDADGMDDVSWLAQKIVQLRIFNDHEGVMNVSVNDVGGELLLVSQFTLHASTKKGNRPSYIRASKPEHAVPMFDAMIRCLTQELGRPIQTGRFGADMQVSLVNDGPVTILIDTKNKE